MQVMGRTVEELAKQAADCFETARRATGDTETGPREDGDTYERVRDGSPEWVTDLVREAHNVGASLMLPDDWRYACIAMACQSIADGEDDSGTFADDQVDVYNSDRLAWLSSSLYRASYCDDAQSEGLVSEDADLLDRIGVGQYMEASEVFGLVYSFLEGYAADLELPEEDAPCESTRHR